MCSRLWGEVSSSRWHGTEATCNWIDFLPVGCRLGSVCWCRTEPIGSLYSVKCLLYENFKEQAALLSKSSVVSIEDLSLYLRIYLLWLIYIWTWWPPGWPWRNYTTKWMKIWRIAHRASKLGNEALAFWALTFVTPFHESGLVVVRSIYLGTYHIYHFQLVVLYDSFCRLCMWHHLALQCMHLELVHDLNFHSDSLVETLTNLFTSEYVSASLPACWVGGSVFISRFVKRNRNLLWVRLF